MKSATLVLATVLFGVCLPATRAADPAPAAAEPTPHQRIYSLEHRLLPKWTHQSDGAFYDDLRSGRTDRLREVATKIVGAAFAEKLTVRTSTAPAGIVIGFAPPAEVVECFFVFIAREGGAFRYITFEKSEDIMGKGLKACIGEWSTDGAHRNFGFSKEETEEAFLQSVTELLQKPGTAPGASFKPSTEPSPTTK